MNARQALARLLSLPVIGNVAVMKLQPGDVLVVECAGPIDDDAVGCIRHGVEQTFPGHRCIVMVDGLTLKAARENGGVGEQANPAACVSREPDMGRPSDRVTADTGGSNPPSPTLTYEEVRVLQKLVNDLPYEYRKTEVTWQSPHQPEQPC